METTTCVRWRSVASFGVFDTVTPTNVDHLVPHARQAGRWTRGSWKPTRQEAEHITVGSWQGPAKPPATETSLASGAIRHGANQPQRAPASTSRCNNMRRSPIRPRGFYSDGPRRQWRLCITRRRRLNVVGSEQGIRVMLGHRLVENVSPVQALLLRVEGHRRQFRIRYVSRDIQRTGNEVDATLHQHAGPGPCWHRRGHFGCEKSTNRRRHSFGSFCIAFLWSGVTRPKRSRHGQ
mmetsp:Transcript_31922/g.85421  ORF Transcript_31922/g.85421 Transcript_31922/m.85421 type:complete len:236 (+) Transcript_31922:440-1147(+)